jgi:tetratricopeptide (TPR) repeat protein
VSALTHVGMIQRLRERFSEAERLLSAAADMAVALYGPDHVNVLTAEAEWGLALYGTGRWNEGEAMYRDAIPRAMSTLGPMHPTTSSLQEGLATILTGRGRFEEALELYRQGMEERRFRYGDIDHPAFVASLNRIAEPLIGLDRLDEARAVLRQAMEMNTRLGSDSGASVYTIIAEQSLGNIAWRQGRPAVAEEHFHTALALADELLRPDHRYTQSLKRDYGVFLGATGRIAEAVETLRWVLRTQERLLGVPHPQIEQTAAALRAATGAGGPETP